MLEHMMNKPNLFIVGAQKCGTTRLSYLLSQHPDIFISSLKEPELFNLEVPSAERIDRYEKLFSDVSGAKIVGEASTVYSRVGRFPGTAQRIHQFNPSARIIYMVRHPLDRIESAWVQCRSEEREMSSNFCHALRTAPDLLDSTLYWKQLNCYRQFFTDDNILLFFFEDFIKNERAFVEQCFEFLGVDASETIAFDEKERNSFQGKKQAKPLLDLLRSMPLYEQLRHLLPKGSKHKLKRSLMQSIESKPQWDRDTLCWAINQVEGDMRELLRYAGKEEDYWKLSMERSAKS